MQQRADDEFMDYAHNSLRLVAADTFYAYTYVLRAHACNICMYFMHAAGHINAARRLCQLRYASWPHGISLSSCIFVHSNAHCICVLDADCICIESEVCDAAHIIWHIVTALWG